MNAAQLIESARGPVVAALERTKQQGWHRWGVRLDHGVPQRVWLDNQEVDPVFIPWAGLVADTAWPPYDVVSDLRTYWTNWPEFPIDWR